MNAKLAYEDVDDNAKFREQYRFVFAGVIIAAVLALELSDNVIQQFWMIVLGVSAFCAALYLILSAAQIKYKDPGMLYEVVLASEKLRRRAFDWSVSVFGLGCVYFLSLFLTGLLYELLGVGSSREIGGVFVLFLVALVVILILVIAERLSEVRISDGRKDLSKI